MKYYLFTITLILAVFTSSFSQSTAVTESMNSGDYERAISLILSEGRTIDNMERRHLENLGYCYVMVRDYRNAKEVYKELLNRRNPKSEYHLFYAEILFVLEYYDLAKEHFKKYYEKNPMESIIKVKIASCDSIKSWATIDTEYKISNLEAINTVYNETSAIGFGNDILFISNYVDEDKDGDSRLIPHLYRFNGKASNQIKEHISGNYWVTSITYNQTKDIFAYSLRTIRRSLQDFSLGNSIIMIAEQHNGEITQISKFKWDNQPENINITHPAFNNSGNRLYFASDIPGGYGGMDLYYSDFDGNSWSEPTNLGENINTPFNEVSPYISGDTVIYFSSNGHPGYGNLDVFKSYINQNGYTKVENLKSPVNSVGDDMFFRPVSEYEALLTSNRSAMSLGGYDIFQLNIPIPEEPEVIEEPEIIVEEVHRFDPKSFELPFVLFNINSSTASDAYNNALAKIADTLKKYDYIKLEIHGFADRVGPESFNEKLSIKRAENIAEKLINMGVDPSRIITLGKGVSQLDKANNIGYHVVIGTVADDSQSDWYSRRLNNKYEIGMFQNGDFYSYFVGNFDNFQDAAKLRDDIRNINNFETAYIVYSYFEKFFTNYRGTINRRATLRIIKTD